MNNNTNTILLANRHGSVRSLAFSPRRAMLILSLLLLTLCGSLLYSGYRIGVSSEISTRLTEVANLRAQARQHHQSLQDTRRLAQHSLDALTLRLGRMQAQMLRLDTLGSRLVAQAGLDGAEFDFSLPPPVGGPHGIPAAEEVAVPEFLSTLDTLDSSLSDRSRKLRLLERLLMFRDLNERVQPSGDVVENGLVSSKFGPRIDPFTGKWEQHKGIDVAGKAGSDVLALGDGIVIWSGERSGYGKLVEVDHGNGYITRYAHNRKLLVNTGSAVRKGTAVALLGSTGRSTGPHVHIEVLHHGEQVNPDGFLEGN
jgi:murein DD-endopeptidase MepM/ murein hydrolase activator NlpD